MTTVGLVLGDPFRPEDCPEPQASIKDFKEEGLPLVF